MGSLIHLSAADGSQVPAYVAQPAAPAKAAVVVIQEIFGVNVKLCDMGWCVLTMPGMTTWCSALITQEALDQRPKTLLNFGVARGTQGGNAAAVKGFFVDHDDRIVDAFVMTELAR